MFKWRSDMRENSANAFAQFLNEREQHRGTPLGKIIQKIVDFFDGLVHIGRMSERKLAREVESGKVFGRKGRPGQAADQRFTFAGPEARTADKGKAFEAQQMRDAGTSRKEVWDKTGWWEIVPGSDVWSFEIDDSDISLSPDYKAPVQPAGMDELFHGKGIDNLLANYPGVKVGVFLDINKNHNDTGLTKENGAGDGYIIEVDATTPRKAVSIFVHEVQHVIQGHEGFATGGNQNTFNQDNSLLEIRKSPSIQKLYEQADELHEKGDITGALKLYEEADIRARFTGYQRLTGEAEARLTQRRRDMTTKQRKAEAPWITLRYMMQEEGLLQEGQKPEDVLISRYDSAPSYHLEPEYKPKKTVKAYKLMQFKKNQPGKLFPLFIGKDKPIEMGQWMQAEFLPTKGFAERPGWHAGHLPIAPHLRQKSTGKKAPNRVWVEIEMPADKDWQTVADSGDLGNKIGKTGRTKDIRSQVPEDGYYKFKTSKMQGGAWMIGGAAKFNRVLNDTEVAKVLKDAGYSDAEIQNEMHGEEPQYSTSSDRIISEKFHQDPTTKERVSDAFNKAKSKEERSLAMDRFVANTLDGLHFIKQRLGDEAYKMHRMLTGINSSTFSTWLKHGRLFVNGNTFGVHGQNQGPMAFFETLGKKDAENLVYWVSAKRAEQLEAEGRENWLDEDARQAIFDRVGTHASSGKTWAELNLTLQKFNRNILDVAQEAGLIDPEARAEWQTNFYIPFNRIMEDPDTYESFLAGPRKNLQHISAQIRRLKGGEGKIDPMGNLFRNWMFLLDASARNMAREKAFDVGSRVGIIEEVTKNELRTILGSKSVTRYAARKESATKAARVFDTKEQAEEWAEGKPGYQIEQRKYNSVVFGRMKDFGIMSFQRNGQPVYFKTMDKDLFEALSEIDTTAFNNVFMKMMSGSKRWLSYGVTFGPAFRLRNMLRDTMHVAVVSKSFRPFIDSATGFVKALKEDADFKEYSATGFAFGSSYIHTDDPAHASKMIKKLIKQEGDGVVDNILNTPKKFLRAWEKIGEASENAARLGLYTNLRKQGATPFEAGFQARDLMDFSMRGSSQTVQILTRIIPFLNARGQGLYKLSRSAHENPKAFVLKAGMYTVAALALWSLFKDDERYKELQDFDKWTYHHFWLGDDHYRIPKPFEIGALFASMPESVANVMNGTEDGKFVWDWFTFTIHDVFNVGMPQLFKPVIEERFNMSTFRGQRIVPEHMTKLEPSEQYKEYTSESMRAIGKKLNISPIKLEHYVRGYFSTLGLMVLTVSDAVVREAGGYPSQPAGGPNPFLLGVVNKQYSSNKYVNRFYDFYNEVDSAYSTLRHFARTGQVEEVESFLAENADLISMRTPTTKIRSMLTEVNEKIKQVRMDKEMSPQEKKTEIDALNNLKKEITKKLFSKVRGR